MNEKSFEFGKNWESFVKKYLDQERIHEAKRSLAEFLGTSSLEGKTFVDVGCGSGLFSLAAYTLGASLILSFDADADSVKCCEYLREKEGFPEHWKVEIGSVLDGAFVSALGKYDIVYSWGVLHHTGKMWKAIENTAGLVSESGMLYIAIYNKADGIALYPDGRFGSSKFWEKEKKFYASLSPSVQNLADYAVMSALIVMYLLTLRNPVKMIQSHKKNYRGMSWRIDIKDWLGGYPYQYASVAEIFAFVKKLGFSLENLRCNNGLLNNEYLFRRISTPENP